MSEWIPSERLTWLLGDYERLGIPRGRVEYSTKLFGLSEWRFVARGWESSHPYHYWRVVDRDADPALWAKKRDVLSTCPPVTTWKWWLDPEEAETDEVSYDAELRPVLVQIGGIM
jgi:hypothetical protein